MSILLLDTILGVVGLVAATVAWRTGSRAALRLVAGASILITITALPVFFVDVPPAVKLLVGVSTLVTIAIGMLLLSPARTEPDVSD